MLREMIKRHEGTRYKVYRCTSNKRTIGNGHNIDDKGLPPDIRMYLVDHGKITQEMVDILLDQDIEDAITDCNKLYPDFLSFSKPRQDALIDFLFNVGLRTAHAFINTNRAINEGRWNDAAEGLLASKYARQVGGRAIEIADMLIRG